MIHFYRFILAMAILLAANLLYWPPQKNYIRGKAAPPPDSQKVIYEQYMRQIKPQIILLGNSILGYAVDGRMFTDMIQNKRVGKFKMGGGETAWWYMVLKNVILTAPQKPQMVAIFFRDHYLTDPTYRSGGEFKQYIDWMASDSEPVLDRLAYQTNLSPMSRFFAQCSPLYQQKSRLNPRIQQTVKSFAASILPGKKNPTPDAAIENLFDEKNMDNRLLTARQLAAESVADENQYDFDKQVQKSFLPYLIEEADKYHVKLVFVRMKRCRDVVPGQQPEALVRYIEKLKTYLNEKGCSFIDFTNDPRITEDLYGAGDHFSDHGMKSFTPMLVDAMLPMIRQLPP
jgi:hypothetical protein